MAAHCANGRSTYGHHAADAKAEYRAISTSACCLAIANNQHLQDVSVQCNFIPAKLVSILSSC